ncbi:Hypothetical predicted protein [Podarcis lilfordi]|uniref:Uncharacterized protein n=1 Tax=Podarcis lilfordi TaxID=74358 RepID=A0AA35KJS8_9SAUR|nr:Hypothetical predicted protein [Podarcis lilfordi]
MGLPLHESQCPNNSCLGKGAVDIPPKADGRLSAMEATLDKDCSINTPKLSACSFRVQSNPEQASPKFSGMGIGHPEHPCLSKIQLHFFGPHPTHPDSRHCFILCMPS